MISKNAMIEVYSKIPNDYWKEDHSKKIDTRISRKDRLVIKVDKELARLCIIRLLVGLQ